MSTDNDCSEMKTYYFYQLEKPDDLLANTFQRRVLKSRQGRHPGFLFHQSGQLNLLEELYEFFKVYITKNDAVLIPLNEFERSQDILMQLMQEKGFEIYITVKNKDELKAIFKVLEQQGFFALLQPQTKKDLINIASEVENLNEAIQLKVSFLPKNYEAKGEHRVSALDYLELLSDKKLKINLRNKKIPYWNCGVAKHFELEPIVEKTWDRICRKNSTNQIRVSVIVPTFNNARFLVNVITHLAEQEVPPENYEVIIVDDGSEDGSKEIVKKYVENHNLDLNLSYFYWSKQDLGRGPQNFFRPGQARNLAASYAQGENLVFLDSDMLVPPNFISECQQGLNDSDLIQFQRYHINQTLSLTNPRWKQISLKRDCYIEEKHYWNQLFQSDDWNQLPQRWKFVCTYALGMRRTEFFEIGRIKRHFISYGFEDTDLGFRMHNKNKKFKLIKTPLLHLTNYSAMQYQNSMFKRHELLSVTAKLFFLDELDFEVGTTLKTFLGGEKGLIERFKDRFLDN